MAEFKDGHGRPWEILIDGPTIKRVRDVHQLDLVALGEGSPWQRLEEDLVLRVDVLWTILAKQAISRDIEEESFAAAMVGDGLANASSALVDAVADFFPTEKRSLLLSMLRKNQAIQTRGYQIAMAKIEDPELMARLEKQIETRIDEAMRTAIP